MGIEAWRKNEALDSCLLYTSSYKQFMNIKKHMRDEKTGLYYHGYDESGQMVFYLESKYGKDWADPVTSTLNLSLIHI